MNRKKIFAWCDSPTCTTGFGNVARNLMSNIYKEFDLEILGINYFGHERYNTNKWFIYSVDVGVDPYGHKKLPHMIKKSKPDVIFLFQDIFNIDMVLSQVIETAPNVPIILYYPVDGAPVAQCWKDMMYSKNVSKHFIYSEFSEREIRKTFPDLKTPFEILYHGVDFNSFYKLEDRRINEIRKKLTWDNKFIAVNVNVYQPRKFTMGTMRSMALLRYGYKKCKCGNYYMLDEEYCPLNNCSSEDVIDTVLPKTDVGLYMHMSTQNRAMGPLKSNLLQSHALNAGWKDDSSQTGSLFLLAPNKNLAKEPFSEEDLNKIYNAANVNLTSTIGEGFGLNLVEASACGTTTIAPRNSAIPEILQDTGHLVNNCGFFTQGMDNGHVRPIVSIPRVVDALEIEYQKWLDNDKIKVINEAAIENVKTRFRWEDKTDQLMRAFRECA